MVNGGELRHTIRFYKKNLSVQDKYGKVDKDESLQFVIKRKAKKLNTKIQEVDSKGVTSDKCLLEFTIRYTEEVDTGLLVEYKNEMFEIFELLEYGIKGDMVIKVKRYE